MERFKEWKPPRFDDDNYAHERLTSTCLLGEFSYNGKEYGWRCDYNEYLKLGYNTDIGFGTYINAKYGVEIGNNVQIGGNCLIYSDNTENNTQGKVVIGENSLIGSFCLILPGAIIPPNSKIKAYSIVGDKK